MRISDWSSDVCSSDLLRDQNRIARSHRRGQTRIAVGHPPLLSEVGLSGIHEAKKYLLGAQIGLHQIAECGTVRTRPSQLRSEEHTSELQSLMRISYAVFCLKKKTNNKTSTQHQ